MSFLRDSSKRAFDLVVGTIGLAAATPVLLVSACLVKVESTGPVFFTQTRVGKDGKPFRIIKLRTMSQNSEPAGPLVTASGDPRITRVGRVLRRTKLDELPQLINVVSGSMSLVGPRPEVPRYVEMFAQQYRDVLRVRPGITDEASIVYRDEETLLASATDPERAYVESILPRKLELYRQYVHNHSLAQDLSIILRSLRAIVRL